MNDTKTTSVPESTPSKPSEEQALTPDAHLQQFLKENNYELSVDALTNENPYLEGKGFVLTDKPLLVITVKKKGDK